MVTVKQPRKRSSPKSPVAVDSALSAIAQTDSASKKKPVRAKVEFNHEALRKALTKVRKILKLNLKYAAEACGIAVDRLGDLERGYRSHLPELPCKFNVHELLSVCLAFDLDIWAYTVMPVQLSILDGTLAERRDRAWSECQSAWQANAELRQLLSMALSGKISGRQRTRAADLCKLPPAGTIGIG